MEYRFQVAAPAFVGGTQLDARDFAGGHLDCVLHATRSSVFPAAEVAAIREHTRAAVILVASGA